MNVIFHMKFSWSCPRKRIMLIPGAIGYEVKSLVLAMGFLLSVCWSEVAWRLLKQYRLSLMFLVSCQNLMDGPPVTHIGTHWHWKGRNQVSPDEEVCSLMASFHSWRVSHLKQRASKKLKNSWLSIMIRFPADEKASRIRKSAVSQKLETPGNKVNVW